MKITHILILFSIQALIGLTLASFMFSNKKRPLFLVFLHGVFAVFGLATLTYYNADETMDQAHSDSISALLFSLAALLGIAMLVGDKALGKTVPRWMPIVHGLLAVAGYAYLWIYTLAK